MREEFAALLRSGERQLRIKQGFDPTRPNLHIGHAVGMRKLRTLARWGHEIVLIVGDWTTQIGDPTDRDETRPTMSHAGRIRIALHGYNTMHDVDRLLTTLQDAI